MKISQLFDNARATYEILLGTFYLQHAKSLEPRFYPLKVNGNTNCISDLKAGDLKGDLTHKLNFKNLLKTL